MSHRQAIAYFVLIPACLALWTAAIWAVASSEPRVEYVTSPHPTRRLCNQIARRQMETLRECERVTDDLAARLSACRAH